MCLIFRQKILIQVFKYKYTLIINVIVVIDTVYEHILSSVKITLLKKKDVEKANSRGIKLFKSEKNLVIDQLDSAMIDLRLLASRVPERANELCIFLEEYSENLKVVSIVMQEKVNKTVELIKSE